MRNIKKSFGAIMLCTSVCLFSMEPMDGPTTSSESGIEHTIYYKVSPQNKKELQIELSNLKRSINWLDEILATKENEESSSAKKETIKGILKQKKVTTKAIELTEKMYFGIIPVDMMRIQEEKNRWIR